MVGRAQALVLFALVGMAWWLFGNLYEAFVISPNWVEGSRAQLERLNGFFVHTTPTHYFVPMAFVAPASTWLAWALRRRAPEGGALRRASLFALLASSVNALIVGTIIGRLFGDGFRAESEEALHALCVRWNTLNALRMAMTFGASFWLFEAFRRLDRARDEGGSSERGCDIFRGRERGGTPEVRGGSI